MILGPSVAPYTSMGRSPGSSAKGWPPNSTISPANSDRRVVVVVSRNSATVVGVFPME